jgi:hypothetical protein
MTPSQPSVPLPQLPGIPQNTAQAPTFLGGTDERRQRKSPAASFLGPQDLPMQAKGGWKTLIGT